ncbi:MAG TPA: SMP-30/gluconolactonase/LRE family protein [Blastocatellia bacterium]
MAVRWFRRRLAAAGFLLIAMIVMIAIPLSKTKAVSTETPVPHLGLIFPLIITAGAPSFTLRCRGRFFQVGAVIEVDGIALPNTTLIKLGSGDLSHIAYADVDASVVASPGSHTVDVLNPDGNRSHQLVLTVVAPDPTLFIRLAQNTVQADPGGLFELNVTGQGFEQNSAALIWGRPVVATIFNNPGFLTVVLPEKDLGQPARIPIMVENAGHFSNTEIFNVSVIPPKLSSVAPDTVTVGNIGVPVIVQAKNLLPSAQLVVNGQVLASTVQLGATGTDSLAATIPPSFFATPSELVIRAEQNDIESDTVVLDVTPNGAPYIYAIAPVEETAGLQRKVAKHNIRIFGANFVQGSRGLLDGQSPLFKLKRESKFTLISTQKAGFFAAPGTHTLQVVSPDGQTSNTVTFTTVPDATTTTISSGTNGRVGFDEGCVTGKDITWEGPRRLTLGPDGLLYVNDQLSSSVRTLNLSTGEVCTVAGLGVLGYADTGNPRNFPPSFSNPNGILIGPDGTLYVTENGNNVIRMIQGATTSSPNVQTYIGSWIDMSNTKNETLFHSTKIGLEGFLDGPATQALMSLPDDIVMGADGTIYFADAGNSAIRKIVQTPNGPSVVTISGNGFPAFFDGIGEQGALNIPTGICLDPTGTFLYIADFGTDVIRKLDLRTNALTTYAGTSDQGFLDGPAMVAMFDSPIGIACDTDGSLYVSDFGDSRIRKIDPQGNVFTIAGGGTRGFNDGTGVEARFARPTGLSLDTVNRILYVADFNNAAIRAIQLPN